MDAGVDHGRPTARSVLSLRDLGPLRADRHQMLAWGILFSLSLKRPLLAVIAAATSESVSIGIVSLLCNHVVDVHQSIAVDIGSLKAISVRLLIVAFLAAADVWLAARWFRGPRSSARRGTGISAKSRSREFSMCICHGGCAASMGGRQAAELSIWHRRLSPCLAGFYGKISASRLHYRRG